MDFVREPYGVPNSVVLEALGPNYGVIDSEQFVGKVALLMSLFLMGLHLSFCRPIRDVLDYLGLAMSQLHPNPWSSLLSCCIVCGEYWALLMRNIPTLQLGSSNTPIAFDVLAETYAVSVEPHYPHVKYWPMKFFLFFIWAWVGNTQWEKSVAMSFLYI